MFKYTKHFLKKVEDLFSELDYTIRYEKGNFKSGYCIVEDRQIAVINRFFETEARINVLIEILSNVEIDSSKLDEKNTSLYKELQSIALSKEEENKDKEPIPSSVELISDSVELSKMVEVATESEVNI